MVQERLKALGSSDVVLDLGGGRGSFAWQSFDCRVVRLDLSILCDGYTEAVVADAAAIPLQSGTVSAVIANHSLEHIASLPEVVKGISRTLKPGGFVYISVPDATTISDRLYRWIGRGGGHINGFRSHEEIPNLILSNPNLVYRKSRTLYSSFSFLGPRSRGGRFQKKLVLFLGAPHWLIAFLSGLLRILDYCSSTRYAVYGWEYLFEYPDGESLQMSTGDDWGACWTNVCSSCGAAHSLARLRGTGNLMFMVGVLGLFRCPCCENLNVATGEVANVLQPR
jgi:predicted SAM-dependent methyltransferase